MIKLGLIGKNIAHSKSQAMYEKLLDGPVDYSLLDYPQAEDIPAITDLIEPFRGLSITTPYKETFIDQMDDIDPHVRELGAINCMVKNEGKLSATNTDFLALKELLNSELESYPASEVIILGDGVMSRVTQKVLELLGQDYTLFSRKKTERFASLNLMDCFSQDKKYKLCINCCSRNYVYDGQISDEFFFWDLNYAFDPHVKRFENHKKTYRDGLDLLYKQAEHALYFWNIL